MEVKNKYIYTCNFMFGKMVGTCGWGAGSQKK